MADITKCSGKDCNIKNTCYRFTAKSGMWQSYFSAPPFNIDKGKFTCEMFWGEQSEYLLEQLKSIMNK